MESTTDILDAITTFADQAHGTQTRKYSSDRYIVHPVRVMKMCQEYTDDIAVLAAALLHDVLEDTPITKQQIKDFLLTLTDEATAERISVLVDELTDQFVKESYPQWNRRKRKTREAARMAVTSPAAQTIKYADIIDNCREIVASDRDFAKVFVYECSNLLKKMDRGDARLYRRAQDAIGECIRQLRGGGA